MHKWQTSLYRRTKPNPLPPSLTAFAARNAFYSRLLPPNPSPTLSLLVHTTSTMVDIRQTTRAWLPIGGVPLGPLPHTGSSCFTGQGLRNHVCPSTCFPPLPTGSPREGVVGVCVCGARPTGVTWWRGWVLPPRLPPDDTCTADPWLHAMTGRKATRSCSSPPARTPCACMCRHVTR